MIRAVHDWTSKNTETLSYQDLPGSSRRAFWSSSPPLVFLKPYFEFWRSRSVFRNGGIWIELGAKIMELLMILHIFVHVLGAGTMDKRAYLV